MVFEHVLEKIEPSVRAVQLKRVQQLPYDRWLLASLLQKAIRRGEINRAASAALSLWSQDRRMFWRRCGVIAAEDIGIGSIEAVVEAAAICKTVAWRRRVGDGNAAVYIAKRMASVPKSRFLTELYFEADRGIEASAKRQEVALVGYTRLKNIFRDNQLSPADRALALWAIAGTRQFPAKGFSRIVGDRAKLQKLIEELDAPDGVKACSTIAGFDTPWPLMMFLPIAWQMFEQEKQELYIEKEPLLSTSEVQGMPTYAADALYTRTGQASVRELKKAVPALKSFSGDQIGEVVFFLEAELVDKRLTSPALASFRRRSIKTVMADLGVGCEDYSYLRRTLSKHWDVLTEIRIAKLRQLLPEAPDDLLLFTGVDGEKG